MGSIRVYKIFIDCLAPESARLIDRFRHKLSVILAQLADCPLNRLKTGKSIREGASPIFPHLRGRPASHGFSVYFIPSGPGGAGRGQTIPPRPEGPGEAGRLFPVLARRARTEKDYLGIRPLLGPALGLWFHSGLYGSILASVWPMVPFRLHSGPWFRFGLLVKSCAKQRRPRPEHTGGGICLAQILYKRGLLIRLQKRKIKVRKT